MDDDENRSDEFELQREPELREVPREFCDQERTKQGMLLTGLDELPGQRDLF